MYCLIIPSAGNIRDVCPLVISFYILFFYLGGVLFLFKKILYFEGSNRECFSVPFSFSFRSKNQYYFIIRCWGQFGGRRLISFGYLKSIVPTQISHMP